MKRTVNVSLGNLTDAIAIRKETTRAHGMEKETPLLYVTTAGLAAVSSLSPVTGV